MKNWRFPTLLIVTLFILAPTVHGQSSATIRARYAAVEREVPHCQTVKRTLFGYAEEGSGLTAYLRHGVAQKFVLEHLGETGKATETYYFWQGRLFFVLHSEYQYQKPLGQSGAPGRIMRTSQDRLYFRDGKLVRWQGTNDDPHAIPSPEATKAEWEYLKVTREMLTKVRRK